MNARACVPYVWTLVFGASAAASCSSGEDTIKVIHLGDDDAGGEGGDGSGGSSGSGGRCGTPVASVCDRAMRFDTGFPLAIAADENDQFGSVTPDELAIAWMTGDEPDAVVHYAERATPSEPFAGPRELEPSAGPYALDRVALAPDGLVLVVVRADRTGFRTFVRQSPEDDFALPEERMPYDGLNNDTSELVADPLFSADGSIFYYSSDGAGYGGYFRAFVAEDGTDSILAEPELASEPGTQKRLSGVSSDGMTLFFWDDVAGVERAAFRNGASCPYGVLVEVGDRFLAAPSSACDRLYFSSGDGLATADRL